MKYVKVKGVTILMVLVLIMFVSSMSIKAYETLSIYPSNAVQTFYISSNCPTAGLSAVSNAISTWNGASPTTFRFVLGNSGNKSSHKATYNSTKKDMTSDGYNTIGTVLNALEVSSVCGRGAVAFCYSFRSTVQTTRFSESDICINSLYTFGNGAGIEYCDYQGVFTHELGHALALGDCNYSGSVLSCPTMYGAGTLSGTTGYIYYYLRSLTSDDKSGKKWMGTMLGFD